MNKILYVTTIASTMSFFTEHLKMLLKEGYVVELATNTSVSDIPDEIKELDIKVYNIPFSRNPLDKNNVKAFRMLNALISMKRYNIVHTHTPIASVIVRVVCNKFRKRGMKVFYTAHGFHFYKGAPKKMWMFFYPIEYLCSFMTDKLITINKEDYGLAKKRFHAKETLYIPGVGFDYEKFANTKIDIAAKKEELGIKDGQFIMLSVGELNENKNHEIIVRCLPHLPEYVHYYIAGEGDKQEWLLKLAKDLKVEHRLHLLGQRNDVNELYKIADVFVHPSFREGLPVSVMEAMAAGIPCLVSDIRGGRDLIANNEDLIRPENYNQLLLKLNNYIHMWLNEIEYNKKNNINKIIEFSYENIIKKILKMYIN